MAKPRQAYYKRIAAVSQGNDVRWGRRTRRGLARRLLLHLTAHDARGGFRHLELRVAHLGALLLGQE